MDLKSTILLMHELMFRAGVKASLAHSLYYLILQLSESVM